jgi:hypothetical protein
MLLHLCFLFFLFLFFLVSDSTLSFPCITTINPRHPRLRLRPTPPLSPRCQSQAPNLRFPPTVVMPETCPTLTFLYHIYGIFFPPCFCRCYTTHPHLMPLFRLPPIDITHKKYFVARFTHIHYFVARYRNLPSTHTHTLARHNCVAFIIHAHGCYCFSYPRLSSHTYSQACFFFVCFSICDNGPEDGVSTSLSRTYARTHAY